MSIPDSQSVMFTHIPSAIFKEWTLSPVSESDPLISCELRVRFRSDLDLSSLETTLDQPEGTSQILRWKNARRLWDALNTCIASTLTDTAVSDNDDELARPAEGITSHTRFDIDPQIRQALEQVPTSTDTPSKRVDTQSVSRHRRKH